MKGARTTKGDRLEIRCSEAEKDLLERRALNENLTLSEYARKVLLEEPGELEREYMRIVGETTAMNVMRLQAEREFAVLNVLRQLMKKVLEREELQPKDVDTIAAVRKPMVTQEEVESIERACAKAAPLVWKRRLVLLGRNTAKSRVGPVSVPDEDDESEMLPLLAGVDVCGEAIG